MTVISSTSFFACDYQWQICKAYISETTVNSDDDQKRSSKN